jgi:HopA1 effector protein family
MNNALRLASDEIFRTVEILTPTCVRLGASTAECDPNALLAFLQAEVYRRFYGRFRDVAAEMTTAQLIARLQAVNRSRPLPRESTTGLPHNYIALGAEPPLGVTWLRLYWNVGPEGAVALMDRATDLLGVSRTPFQLKVMLDTGRRRRDGAVLYVPVAYWQAAARLLTIAYGDVANAGDMEPEAPLFTRPVRAGVGLAEDPGGAHSFGTHRSLLVALALSDVYLAGSPGDTDGWRALCCRFESAGLCLERPHLNGTGPDPYVM